MFPVGDSVNYFYDDDDITLDRLEPSSEPSLLFCDVSFALQDLPYPKAEYRQLP